MAYRSNQITLNNKLLGENNGVSFTTPLASLHDFNGWTDQFLTTPNTGLQDYSIDYIWRCNPWKIDARYHFFHAADNKPRYGEKLDVDLSININRRSTVLLRYADFMASNSGCADARRIISCTFTTYKLYAVEK